MMDLLHDLNESLRALLHTHALVVVAIVLFFEELGVPSPIPGDLMMVLAGVRAAQGSNPLWLALLVQELATVIGASGLFFVCRRLGRPVVLRYGRFLRLTPAALTRAEGFLDRSGGKAIVIGRLVPGLRIVTPIAAGVLGMPFASFLPALALGAFLYILGYTLLGFFVGPAALAIFDRVSLPTSALISLALLVVLALAIRRLWRAPRPPAADWHVAASAAALAGVVAGLAALLAANAFLGLLSFGRRLFGDRPFIVVTDVGSGARLLTGWPGFLLGAALLGVLLSLCGAARLRPVARTAIAVLVPFVLTLIVLYPLLHRNNVDFAGRHQGVRVALDAIRCLVFGVALSACLPLLPRRSDEVRAVSDERSTGAQGADEGLVTTRAPERPS
jgi:membrane protein DedA with SNARE-associated domain